MSELHLRREAARLTIEAEALLKWYKSGGTDTPCMKKSQHVVLLSPHKHGAGCCGWDHYFVLMNNDRILAVYKVHELSDPRLRRLRSVPCALMEGGGISLVEFFAWEDDQAELNRHDIAAIPDSVLPILELTDRLHNNIGALSSLIPSILSAQSEQSAGH
jgi:hypothetical protein